MVQVLKQPQYEPVPVEEQVLAIYAVNEGYFDEVPIADVLRFEKGLREFMQSRYGSLMGSIAQSGELPEGDSLDQAIEAFVKTFSSN